MSRRFGSGGDFRGSRIGLGKVLNLIGAVADAAGASSLFGKIAGIIDAVGTTSDGHTASTIFGKVSAIFEHIHSAPKCYPTLADPVSIQKASGAWAAHGTPTEVIPASTITSDFTITYLSLSSLSIAADYEFKLYTGDGGSEVEVGCIAFTTASEDFLFSSANISANTRISATLSGSNAAQATVEVKVGYHEHA